MLKIPKEELAPPRSLSKLIARTTEKKQSVLILPAGEKPPCHFLGNCCVGGNKTSCSLEVMGGCSQATARKDRANKNCPLMVKVGGKNLKCHVPQLLPFLSLNSACHSGDDCILCKADPDIVAKIARHNQSDSRPKMSDEDIEKAGADMVEAIKKRRRANL